MASNVQFFGDQAVVNAYNNRGINAWAVFQGKNLLTTGEDATTLQTWLDMLQGSTAIYCLKVYDVESADDITEGTDANGSFNFKLLGNPANISGTGQQQTNAAPAGIAGVIQRKLEARIGARIEKMLDKWDLDGDEEGDDEPVTLQSVGMALLKEPQKIPDIVAGVKAILSAIGMGNSGMQNPYGSHPAQPAYIPPAYQSAAVAGVKLSDEEKFSRIGAAIEAIELVDSDFVTHIEQLAALATKDPAKFKNLISMLSVL